MSIFSFLSSGSSSPKPDPREDADPKEDERVSSEEEEYAQDLRDREEQSESDLKETHSALDTEDDVWTSCGDSNSAGKD